MANFHNFALLAILAGTAAIGQSIGNGSLNGKFFARHLMLSVSTNGAITEARTFYGSLTFDGAGSFAYTGTQLVGGASPAPMSGTGTYSIKATGIMTLSNFQRTDSSTIRAGLGQGALDRKSVV